MVRGTGGGKGGVKGGNLILNGVGQITSNRFYFRSNKQIKKNTIHRIRLFKLLIYFNIYITDRSRNCKPFLSYSFIG